MMTFLKQISLLLTLLLSLLIAAAPDIAALEKKAVQKNYPDADSVLLYDIEEMTYQTDGTAVSTDEFYQKVLNEAGRKALRTVPLHCNTNYGSATFTSAEILRGGKKINIDIAANTTVTTSAGQMGSNIYDPEMKITTLAVPGLEIGDVLHIKTERKTLKPIIPGEWSTINALESDIPILLYDIIINAPEKLPLTHSVVKNEINGKVKYFTPEKKNGRIIYKWQASDVPQAIPEPEMPSLYTCCQRLLAGTAKDWQSISRWYYNLCRPRMDAISDEMRKTVAELVKNAKDDDEKIQRIFKYVSQNIRYTGVTAEKKAPGFEPHDVKDTFSQKHGVCRDKAALLVSMLELAGIKAFPVIFMAGTPKDSDVPNGYFNHAVACADKGNRNYVMMDPTDENTRTLFPEYLSNQSYLVARPEGDILRRTPVIPAENNTMKISTSAEVDMNGTLSGSSKIDFSGINDLIYRSSFSRMTPAKRLEFWNSRIRKILPGAELISLDIEPANIRNTARPLVIKFAFKAESFLPESGGPEILALPQFSGQFGTLNWLLPDTALETRRFPIKTDSTCKLTEEFKLTLPQQLQTLGIPKEKSGKSGPFSWAQNFTVRDNTIILKSSATLDSVDIDQKEYQRFRDELHRFAAAEKRFPVVRKNFVISDAEKYTKVFPDADAVVLDSSSELTLDASGLQFESVEYRKILVLTYAGIKKYSELKEYFYPSRENLEIKASVTSRDGKTTVMDSAHTRIMDAPWTADIKHIPAEKIKICALPGISLYSTIEYSVTRKGRKLWQAAGCSIIQQHVPVLNWSLTINTPEKLKLHTSAIPQNTTFTRKNTNGLLVRKWQAQNIPAVKREYSQSSLRFFAPHISYSAATAGVFAQQFNNMLNLKAQQKNSSVVMACFSKIDVSKMSFEEKVKHIRDFAVRSIRVSGPAVTDVPAEVLRTPDEIYASGTATSAERAIVISSLFDAAKIKHRFHLAGGCLFSGPAYRDFIHCFAPDFEAVLIYVPELNAYFNTESQYSSIGSTPYCGKIGINLANGRLSAINSSFDSSNRVDKNYTVKILNNKSAVIDITESFSGTFFEDANRKYSEMTPEIKKRYFISKAHSLDKSAKLNSKYTITEKDRKIIVKYSVTIPDFVRSTGEYQTFELPGHAMLRDLVSVSGIRRTTPYVRNTPLNTSVSWKILSPRGYIHHSGPSWNKQTGNAQTAQLIERRSAIRRELNISLKLTLPAAFIDVADFDNLVSVQNVLGESRSRYCILKKEK